MNRRQRQISLLQSRLARRFDLVDEVLAVGPLRVQFTRVADPQTVLDDICRRIDDYEKSTGERVVSDALGLPYWAELWDSAIGIATWLVNQNSWFAKPPPSSHEPRTTIHEPHAKVMDLGCGMGLSGTAAAMMNADVLFADIETDCLLFSLLNGMRYSETVRARRVNWQTDDLGEKFDVIIGSDVLYDKTQWVHLDRFFRTHLAASGRVLLGEPGRQSGDLFLPWIADRGWTLQRFEQRVPTRTTPIRLFQLTIS